MRDNVAINGQLAASGNFIQRNQLVGAANATAGEINLLNQEQEQSKKELDRARAAANSVREKYVQQIAKIRATKPMESPRNTPNWKRTRTRSPHSKNGTRQRRPR